MFEVRYVKGDVSNQHISVNPDTLLTLLKAHKRKEINILAVEDENHYTYNYESLIENLKL